MEYGSDFSIALGKTEYTEHSIFNFLKEFNALYFDSGRSATKYLLESIKHEYTAVPDYLCESIFDCFTDCNVIHYHINGTLDAVDLDKIPWDRLDVFYLLHYFGSLQNQEVLKYILEKKREFGFIVIEDTTHSLFTSPLIVGDYGVCSLRKWFPIPDGGVLYSKKSLNQDSYSKLARKQSDRIEGMVLKSLYLKGVIKEKDAFRKIFIETENQLDSQEQVFRLSTVSEYILHCVNVEDVILRRKQNHAVLRNAIGDILPEVQTRNLDGIPFIYVTRTENRDALRSYLIKNEVFCPVHWPLPKGCNSNGAIRLSDELISIPIDQRYTEKEVLNTARIIRGFYNE